MGAGIRMGGDGAMKMRVCRHTARASIVEDISAGLKTMRLSSLSLFLFYIIYFARDRRDA